MCIPSKSYIHLRNAPDIKSRQDMETIFESQIQALVATEKLVSYF